MVDFIDRDSRPAARLDSPERIASGERSATDTLPTMLLTMRQADIGDGLGIRRKSRFVCKSEIPSTGGSNRNRYFPQAAGGNKPDVEHGYFRFGAPALAGLDLAKQPARMAGDEPFGDAPGGWPQRPAACRRFSPAVRGGTAAGKRRLRQCRQKSPASIPECSDRQKSTAPRRIRRTRGIPFPAPA